MNYMTFENLKKNPSTNSNQNVHLPTINKPLQQQKLFKEIKDNYKNYRMNYIRL